MRAPISVGKGCCTVDIATSTRYSQLTYLGLNLDAPGAAARFQYGEYLDVRRRRARRVGHRCLVLVSLGLVEVCLAVE